MTASAASVAPAETAVSAVECVDLSYQFAAHLAVDHVNLSIAPSSRPHAKWSRRSCCYRASSLHTRGLCLTAGATFRTYQT
jgi:hypothetical protein